MSEVIYLNLRQNSEVYCQDVFLKDLGSVWSANKDVENRCNEIKVMHIDKKEHVRITCSTIDIIELILTAEPKMQVTNLGENDIIIDYQPKPRKIGLWDWIKTIFVCFTLFFGAAFAIMTFNNDCSVSDAFAQIYKLVMGSEAEGASIIEASYSVGIPIGIILFFNHFSKKSMAKDPTPIEVQMRNYESEVNEAIIKNAERKEKGIDTA